MIQTKTFLTTAYNQCGSFKEQGKTELQKLHETVKAIAKILTSSELII